MRHTTSRNSTDTFNHDRVLRGACQSPSVDGGKRLRSDANMTISTTGYRLRLPGCRSRSIDVDAQKERCTGCYVVTIEDYHGASATSVSILNFGDTSRSAGPCEYESFSNKTSFPNFPKYPCH